MASSNSYLQVVVVTLGYRSYFPENIIWISCLLCGQKQLGTKSERPSLQSHRASRVPWAASQDYLQRISQPRRTITMSYSSRPLPSHLRQASTAGNSASTGQSPILLSRISEKKAELENLKQLRDLSAGLAGQMQMLEEKLATLSDGTEG